MNNDEKQQLCLALMRADRWPGITKFVIVRENLETLRRNIGRPLTPATVTREPW